MRIMRGMIHSLDVLAEKIGSSYHQPPPLMVVLESSKPQYSETPRVEKYVAPPRRESKFGQPSKWKEITKSPKVMGIRPSQFVPRGGQLGPSFVQSAQTSSLGCDESPSGCHQNFRQTYNPLYEEQISKRQS